MNEIEQFIEMVSLRYSIDLTRRVRRKQYLQYTREHYFTGPITSELKGILNELLVAETPEQIAELRTKYLDLRAKLSNIRDKRDKDKKVQSYRAELKEMGDLIKELDEAVVTKLAELGHPVRELSLEDARARARAILPESRQAPADTGADGASAKPE